MSCWHSSEFWFDSRPRSHRVQSHYWVVYVRKSVHLASRTKCRKYKWLGRGSRAEPSVKECKELGWGMSEKGGGGQAKESRAIEAKLLGRIKNVDNQQRRRLLCG